MCVCEMFQKFFYVPPPIPFVRFVSIFLGIGRPAAFATFFSIKYISYKITHDDDALDLSALDMDFNLVQPLLSFLFDFFRQKSAARRKRL